MCDQWDTDGWSEKSKVGRNNHKENLCRHIGGSIGFDEHRETLEKMGKKVPYKYLFIETHATKECKKRILDKEIGVHDLNELDFVTTRAKVSYVSYMKELEKAHGDKNEL